MFTMSSTHITQRLPAQKGEAQPPAAPSDHSDDEAELRARERALVRKVDLHVIPLVMLLYLMSFLDR